MEITKDIDETPNISQTDLPMTPKHDAPPENVITTPLIPAFSFGSFTAPPNTSVNIIENPEDDSVEPASPYQVPTENLEIELEKPVEEKHIEDTSDDKLNEIKNVEDSLEDASCVRIRPVDIENIKTKRRGTKPAPPVITDITPTQTAPVKQPTKPTEFTPPPKPTEFTAPPPKPTEFTAPPPKPTPAPKKKNRLIATYKAGPKAKK